MINVKIDRLIDNRFYWEELPSYIDKFFDGKNSRIVEFRREYNRITTYAIPFVVLGQRGDISEIKDPNYLKEMTKEEYINDIDKNISLLRNDMLRLAFAYYNLPINQAHKLNNGIIEGEIIYSDELIKEITSFNNIIDEVSNLEVLFKLFKWSDDQGLHRERLRSYYTEENVRKGLIKYRSEFALIMGNVKI